MQSSGGYRVEMDSALVPRFWVHSGGHAPSPLIHSPPPPSPYSKGLPPFWENRKEGGGKVFHNTITNSSQGHKPASVHGGILADDMGLVRGRDSIQQQRHACAALVRQVMIGSWRRAHCLPVCLVCPLFFVLSFAPCIRSRPRFSC